MINLKKLSLLGTLFIAMGSSAESVVTLENPSSANFASTIPGSYSFSMGMTLFTPDSKHTILKDYTYFLNNPNLTSMTVQGAVFEWDAVNNRITGSSIYISDLITLDPSVSVSPLTINTNKLKLSSDKKYIFLLSAEASKQLKLEMGSNLPNTDMFYKFYNDSSELSLTPWTFYGLDLAFIFNFLENVSKEDTLASMQPNASGLRQIFTLQTDALNDNLNQSCDYFNQDKFCLSFTGKYTTTNESNDIDATSGIVNVAYKVSPNFYVGGSLEQVVSDIETQGVSYRQKTPDLGIYTGWTQKENGDGWLARMAYRHSNGQLSVQREVIGTSEAGYGQTELSSDGYQLSIGNAVRLSDIGVFTPYAGVRYSEIERHRYSEKLTDDVTLPLHYDDLSQKVTTAFAGAKFDTHLSTKLGFTGSFGIEKDLDREVDEYSAIGVDGLDSIVFDDRHNDVRAVASMGLNYTFSKNQQLGVQAAYREQAYDPSSTTSAYISYTTSF